MLIEEGAAINAFDGDGQTALHLAAAKGQTKALKVSQIHTFGTLSQRRLVLKGALVFGGTDQQRQRSQSDGASHGSNRGVHKDHKSKVRARSEVV